MQYELRVGGPGFDAQALAQALLELRVDATIHPTLNVAATSSRLEAGAVLYLYGCDKARVCDVWRELQARFAFRCAYISVYDRGFHGCMLDYTRASHCPMSGPTTVDDELQDHREGA